MEKSDRRYHHVPIGVNSRFDALQMAILLPNLEILDEELALREHLKAQGIPTAVLDGLANLPVGDRLAEQVVSLPMHPYLDQDVTQQNVQAVAQGIERNAQS